MASIEDPRTGMKYMEHLRSVALAGVGVILEKTRTYGPSWKRRLGIGAWMTTVRPWDRLEKIVEEHGHDIFAAIEAEPTGADGSALACVRDMRNYLTLIEAEMVARGVVLDPGLGRTQDDIVDLRNVLRRMVGNAAPHSVESLLDHDGMTQRISLVFSAPTHHTIHERQMEVVSLLKQELSSPEQVELATDAARAQSSAEDTEAATGALGAGPVADGCYTTLDLGRSTELWNVGLGALPSDRRMAISVFELHKLESLSQYLHNNGCLVASRQVEGGDSQILIRIPRRK